MKLFGSYPDIRFEGPRLKVLKRHFPCIVVVVDVRARKPESLTVARTRSGIVETSRAMYG